jgi:hypothetical protein
VNVGLEVHLFKVIEQLCLYICMFLHSQNNFKCLFLGGLHEKTSVDEVPIHNLELETKQNCFLLLLLLLPHAKAYHILTP